MAKKNLWLLLETQVMIWPWWKRRKSSRSDKKPSNIPRISSKWKYEWYFCADIQVNQALTSQSDKGNNSNREGIIDSKSTYHLIGNPKLFYNYKFLSGSEKIYVADRTKVLIASQGIVFLMNEYLVHDVLHVPDLPSNLISVIRITKDLNCTLIFTAYWYVLQDFTIGKETGIGLVGDELYKLPLIIGSTLISNVQNKKSHQNTIQIIQ